MTGPSPASQSLVDKGVPCFTCALAILKPDFPFPSSQRAQLDNNENFQEIPSKFNFLILLIQHTPLTPPLTTKRKELILTGTQHLVECFHPFGQHSGISAFRSSPLKPVKKVRAAHRGQV